MASISEYISIPEILFSTTDSNSLISLAAYTEPEPDTTKCQADFESGACSACLSLFSCDDCQDSCQTSCQNSCQDCQSNYDPYEGRVTTGGTITKTVVGSTSVKIYCSTITDATRYIIAYRNASTSGAIYIPSDHENYSSCLTYSELNGYTITDLEPETSYVINYCGVNSKNYAADPPVYGPFTAAVTVTTLSARPDEWQWDTINDMYSGHNVTLTANEWNNFCERVNEFRDYCGLYSYGFTTVYSGGYIKASHINEAVYALAAMADYCEFSKSNILGYEVSADINNVTATTFIALQNILNSIYA